MSENRSDLVKIGKCISELRKRKGYTQKVLGELIDVNDKTISKWEKGDIAPDITVLNALSEALSTDIDVILSGNLNYENNNINDDDSRTLNLDNYRKNYRKELIYLFFGIVVGLIFFAVFRSNSNDEYWRFEVNSEWYISGFVASNSYNSDFVVDKILLHDDKIVDDLAVKELLLRILQDNEIIYEDVINVSDFESANKILNDYKIIIDTSKVANNSNYSFLINIKYENNFMRTFEYNL